MRRVHSILLTDDDESSNFLNQIIIMAYDGADHIHVSRSGYDALDYIAGRGTYKKSKEVYPPQLVLLELALPDMDGWKFLKKLNKLSSKLKNDIAVAILTASANPEYKDKAYKHAGVVDYLEKPLTKEKLQHLLEAHF